LYEISNKRFHRRLLDTIHAGPAIFQSIIERGANRLTVKSPIDSQLASCSHFICADIAKLLFETPAHTSPKTTCIVSRNKFE